MRNNASFHFFVTGIDGEVGENCPIWSEPLPSGLSNAELRRNGYPSYGDYFLAVKDFIISTDYSCLDSSSASDIEKIDIHLEKHGAYYHPGRIKATYKENIARNFVVNLAVNEFAKKTAKCEFDILTSLKKQPAGKYLPSVYGFAETTTSCGAMLSMFSGEWLDGFHEFHFSGGNKKVIVWSPGGNFYLSENQACEAYRTAANILTSFYDTNNFNQIYPWHHAAGDFVISVEKGGGVDIKLITARQYAPLFQFDDEEDQQFSRIIGLLYFFLNMSIRMRLDRLDGINDFIWADDFVLESTVRGFLDSAETLEIDGMTGKDAMDACIKAFSDETFFDMSKELVAMHNQASPEIKVIKENLENHSKTAYRLFSEHLNTI